MWYVDGKRYLITDIINSDRSCKLKCRTGGIELSVTWLVMERAGKEV